MDNVKIKIVLFGIYLLMIWTCNTAVLTIATRIFQDKGMSDIGPFQFAVFFGTVLTFTFFFNVIKVNFRVQLFLSTFSALIFYIFIYLALGDPDSAKIYIGIGAVFGGIGNTYINIITGKYPAYLCEGLQTNIKGHYFGICFLIASLQGFGGATLSFIGKGLISSEGFVLLLMGFCVVCLIYGLIIIENNPNFENSLEISKTFEECSKLLACYKKMKNTIFLVFLDGLTAGIISSSMLHILPRQSSDLIATSSLFVYGSGFFLISYFSSRISDLLEYRIEGKIIILTFALVCLISILASLTQSLPIALIGIFGWGLFLSFVEGFMNIMCCKAYNSDPASFVVNRQVRAIFEVIYSVMMTITQNSIPIPYIMSFLLLFCIPPFIAIKDWNPPQDQDPELMDSD